MTAPLLEVEDLSVVFATRRGLVNAVDHVSFSLTPGESIGLVGESGAGKSTVLRAIMRLVRPPGRISPGSAIRFAGRDLLALRDDQMRGVRGRQIGMIFQDPVNAFNPSFTIGDQLRRVLRLHRPTVPPTTYDAELLRMLERVGVDARRKLDSYPFQFSQGQLQRIMIAAVCLGAGPALLLADEPTTSLDVTIEAQILQLLRDLRSELGLALVLVTHNLALVAELCERVIVMYAGRVMEEAGALTLFEHPAHPYSAQLLRAVPAFPHTGGRLYSMPGAAPVLGAVHEGCPFAPRCERYIGPVCDSETPPAWSTGREGQRAACHLYGPDRLPVEVGRIDA